MTMAVDRRERMNRLEELLNMVTKLENPLPLSEVRIFGRAIAKDILDELEEKCNCYPDFDFEDIKGACPRCRRNIRSKWGIEQSGLYSISYE